MACLAVALYYQFGFSLAFLVEFYLCSGFDRDLIYRPGR